MTITLRSPNPGAPEEALAAFEREIGAELPAPYRAFLAAHEGGYAKSNTFRFPDDSNGDGVQVYYSLTEILDDLHGAAFDTPTGAFPENLIPIAYTNVGNWVCVNTADGSVWFIDHELQLDAGDALVKLAGTFAEFETLVQPFDVSTVQVEPGQVTVTYVDPAFARANAHLFGPDFKAQHPEIFG